MNKNEKVMKNISTLDTMETVSDISEKVSLGGVGVTLLGLLCRNSALVKLGVATTAASVVAMNAADVVWNHTAYNGDLGEVDLGEDLENDFFDEDEDDDDDFVEPTHDTPADTNEEKGETVESTPEEDHHDTTESTPESSESSEI